MLHLLTSNKLMIVLQDKLWGHLRRCQMPDHILSISKDLYHADEFTLLMGIRQLLYSHLSVLNKDVHSPPCCLPSTCMTLIALQTG